MCEGVLEMKTFGEEGKSGFSVNISIFLSLFRSRRVSSSGEK